MWWQTAAADEVLLVLLPELDIRADEATGLVFPPSAMGSSLGHRYCVVLFFLVGVCTCGLMLWGVGQGWFHLEKLGQNQLARVHIPGPTK